jgi:hypothetical protein
MRDDETLTEEPAHFVLVPPVVVGPLALLATANGWYVAVLLALALAAGFVASVTTVDVNSDHHRGKYTNEVVVTEADGAGGFGGSAADHRRRSRSATGVWAFVAVVVVLDLRDGSTPESEARTRYDTRTNRFMVENPEICLHATPLHRSHARRPPRRPRRARRRRPRPPRHPPRPHARRLPTVAAANDLDEVVGVLVVDVREGPASGVLAGCHGETTVRGHRVPVGGDVVVGIDGEPLHSHEQLTRHLITETSPGDSLALDVRRPSGVVTETVTLADRDGDGDPGPPLDEDADDVGFGVAVE